MPLCPECRARIDTQGRGHGRRCLLRNQPVGRRRQAPAEAERERNRRRRIEQAETQRRLARNRIIVARRAAAMLGAPPVEGADRTELDNIAFNIHNAYHWAGRADQCTTAVVRTHGNQYVVFAQRFMTVMEDYGRRHYGEYLLRFEPAGGSHLHAEMWAVLHYLLNNRHPGQEIAEIGVSQPICPLCSAVLNFLGIQFNPLWLSGSATKNWVDPWTWLPPSCKPPVGPHWHRKDEDPDDEPGRGGGTHGTAEVTV
jgi:hypothetical protein